jgi:preprotein translocase subunit SecE
VARNRKRANQRRPRQPSEATDPRRGVPTATEPSFTGEHDHGIEENGAPNPLEHATPDVELAEEQLAYGRPAEPEPGDEADEEEFEDEVEESIEEESPAHPGGELAVSGPRQVEAAHENLLTRLIGFLQGSWRELQRVQWPDRRQVMQATSVVIGFVIVAAAFLGAADWVAGKLVSFILK